MRATSSTPEKQLLHDERRELLVRIEDWLETPMIVLGFVWLALFIVEEVWGATRIVNAVSTTIYIIFIIDFTVKLILAPGKIDYVKSNWLTLIALVVPALRVFRIFRVVSVLRAARVARGLRLVRIVSSLNRGMRALGRTMNRRGFGYVVALTLAVTLVGAAGMYAFENNNPDGVSLILTARLCGGRRC